MHDATLHLLHQAFFGGVAATGFAVLFNCRPRLLPYCCGAGMLALAMRTGSQTLGSTLPVASFFAALTLGLVDRAWQKSQSPQSSIVAVAGAIPMIPGSLAAKVLISVFTLLRAGPVGGFAVAAGTWEQLMILLFTLAALGTGLALPTLITPVTKEQAQS